MICKKCHVEKPIEDFVKNKECRNGVAQICKVCSNRNCTAWKRKNAKILAEKRRKRYAETKGVESKNREKIRKELRPLRVRCQILRSGMRERAKEKNLKFDKEFFTVEYLIDRITKNPNCECCGRFLDMSFKFDNKRKDASPSMDRVDSKNGYVKSNVAIVCWHCNKHKQDSTAKELRVIVDFIDSWKDNVKKWM